MYVYAEWHENIDTKYIENIEQNYDTKFFHILKNQQKKTQGNTSLL